MKRTFNIAIIYYCLLFLFNTNTFGQELPPIQKFTPAEYKGENQNWMFSQASNRFIYTANNEGLLEFNGAEWTIYPSPNNTILRAVKAIKDRIYTGCYMEFGFWETDSFGTLQYQTLTSEFKTDMIEDEHIWNILTYDDWIVFQSFKRVYFYNPKSGATSIIDSTNGISRIFNVDNTIYYHVNTEGLYKIESGHSKLILNDTVFKDNIIINIFSNPNGLLIQTRNSGFYTFHNNTLLPWNTPINTELQTLSVFNSLQLEDKSFVIGTIKNGIVHITEHGDVKYRIDRNNGLSNNTVLSLFEDKDKNIWVALDNGINCINMNSPIRVFHDDEGTLGTVYATVLFKDYLYLGTNQGLFCKPNSTNEPFKFIEGTSGQVWDLFVNENELFCGHHKGTFLVEKDTVTLVSDTPGTWGFKPIKSNKNLLLEGNYHGLNVLEKEDGTWKFRNKIKGFDNSARFFEISDTHEIWVSHGYKGVFKLSVNSALTEVTKVLLDSTMPSDKNGSLTTFRDQVLYAFKDGVYSYNKDQEAFVNATNLSPIVTQSGYVSGKLVVDNTQKLWGFSNDNISYTDVNHVTNTLKTNRIAIPLHLRKGQLGFENISHTEKNRYLIGITDGYLSLDLSKIHNTEKHHLGLNAITLTSVEKKKIKINLKDTQAFDFVNNSITFNYSVPSYNMYNPVQYQYKLEGQFNKWSAWHTKSELTFDNLPFGDYTLKLRARVGNQLAENTINYAFKINRPWFLSNLLLFLYTITLMVVLYITHKSYKKYYKRLHAHKELESERLITRMKNEKLNQDIETKNRELAISTMSLIKKNEVLNSIKKELKKELKKDKKIENSNSIKLINDNLNDSKDWSFFEQAFNNADKDFLDKIKAIHPDLTPNDLRFCAYLRLNLSSKEMAPLLNISLRSVETKRYRLRKKMNLEQDDSLVNYILNF